MFNKKIEICNRALGLVNQAPISSIYEDTKEAQSCNFLYSLIKQDTLVAYPWKASLKTLELTSIGNEFSNLNKGLSYKFLLPEDCLKVILVSEGNYLKQGQYLYCSISKIIVTYSANILDNDLDCSLAYLISLKLACELSYRYSEQNAGLIGLLQDCYNKEFKILANQDSKEGVRIMPTDIQATNYSWLNARIS